MTANRSQRAAVVHNEPDSQRTTVVHNDEDHHDSKNILCKTDAAKFLEISYSEFKRREKQGLYVPTNTDHAGRLRLYDIHYLQARKRHFDHRARRISENILNAKPIKEEVPTKKPVSYISPFNYDQETASLVLTELRKNGEDLVKISIELKIHPSIIMAVHEDWIKMQKRSGGFHVSGESARVIESLGLDGFPVSNGEELASALGAIASTSKPCSACKRNPRRATTLCARCEHEGFGS